MEHAPEIIDLTEEMEEVDETEFSDAEYEIEQMEAYEYDPDFGDAYGMSDAWYQHMSAMAVQVMAEADKWHTVRSAYIKNRFEH